MSSEPTRPLIKKASLIKCLAAGGIAICGYGIYRYSSHLLKADPLEAYKKSRDGELPDTVAIQSNDSVFNHFEDGKPKASFNVRQMQIAQNRQVYNFEGISNGKLAWKGATYNFAADQGTWNGFQKKMVLTGNLKLKGSKFDLKSKEMNYDENRRQFVIPGAVDGVAYGGNLEVASFTYELDKENYRSGKGKWVGILPKEVTSNVPVQTKPSVWDIEFNDSHKVGDVTFYTDARATDGDIIVKAPKMEVNNKTDVMTGTGRVRYFSPKANLIADKIVVFRKEKRAVLTGNVTMLVKPKEKESEPATEVELTPLPPAVPESISSSRPPAPDDETAKKSEDEIRSMKNLRQYPLAITAPYIEYWYKKGERHAKITGNPQARQEMPDKGWRYVWSHHANYDGEKEMLYMFSSDEAKGKREVILKNSVGDEFYGNSGEISTKDDDDTYSFKDGKGKTTTRDEDIPVDDKGKKGGGTDTKDKGKGGGSNLSGPIGRGT